MKIIDRITLIRAGYTRKEIAEMEKAENSEDGSDKKDDDAGNDSDTKGAKDTSSKKEEPETKKEDSEKEDFKKLFEDMKKTLAAIQEANREADHSDGQEPEQSITDKIGRASCRERVLGCG